MSDANSDLLRLAELTSGLSLHEHRCLIYDTQEQQLAAAVPYLRAGLERHERCLYITDENTAATILEALHEGGTDIDRCLQGGALIITGKQDTYLRQGAFDPDLMIGFLTRATADATAARFSGLRTVLGEMTWALETSVSTDKLLEYESKLNHFVHDHDARVICQYNRNRFSPELILGIIRTHPVVVYGGTICKNPYYVPPDEFLKPNQASREVERLLSNILKWENSLAQMRALAGRLQTVGEEERARAARDIHDELGYALAAIKLEFTALLRDLQVDEGPVGQRSQSILEALGYGHSICPKSRDGTSTWNSGRPRSCGCGGMVCGGVSGPHGDEGADHLAGSRFSHRSGARDGGLSYPPGGTKQCRTARQSDPGDHTAG